MILVVGGRGLSNGFSKFRNTETQKPLVFLSGRLTGMTGSLLCVL